VGFLAIGPLLFPVDWMFHVVPDTYPVIQRMHGLGVLPKSLWVLCGPVGVATVILLLRRPLVGFLACVLFAAIYVPTAIVLWGQFSLGSWAAIGAVFIAGFGVAASWRANNSFKPT